MTIAQHPIETTQASALAFATKGYKVLPCHSVINGVCTCGGRSSNCKPGKHPLTLQGVKAASADVETIGIWWNQLPHANVAVATGGDFFVLDVDSRHEGDVSLDDLTAKHGALPLTPTVATGGGGRHYYFRYPKDAIIRSRANLTKGIDTRGDSGYVLAPPSVHLSGNHYEWIVGLDTPLAEPPDWLLALVSEKPAPSVKAGGLILTMRSDDPNDLATHPGVGEGQRNDALCRLVGIHINRGDSPATLEALALAWARRCSPPMPESRVLPILKWAEGKRVVNADDKEGVASDTAMRANEVGDPNSLFVRSPPEPTASESPAPPNTPQPLSAEGETTTDDDTAWPMLHLDAYHGLAGQIVRAIGPETEADMAGVLLTLLAAIGNAVGKRPHFAMNAGVHHPAMFAVLVGDTASGKGQAWSIVQSLMRQADPDWEAESIAYGLSSGEGLVDRVKDDEIDEDEEGARTFTMPKERKLLCVETEFARPIAAMRRDGNTLSPLLRSAWDSQVLDVLTRGKSKLRASNAHIGVIAHITPEELAKLLSGSVEIANGFANRFLWACVRRSKLLPEGGDPSVLDAFREPLAKALAKARKIGRVVRGEAAKAMWASEYKVLTEGRPGAFGSATSRAPAQTLRLSLIFALLDGSEVIEESHLRAALAVWRYCEASARRVFGEATAAESVGQEAGSEPEPLHIRMLNAILRQPGINRRGLHEATGNRIKATDMDQALAILEAQGLAHRQACQSDGIGRPAECWFPGRTVDPPDDDVPAIEPKSEQTPTVSMGLTLTMGRDDGGSTASDHSFVRDETEGGAKAPPAFSEFKAEADMLNRSPASEPEGNPIEPADSQPTQTSEGAGRDNARAKPRYEIGQWVRTTVLDELFYVVDVSVYGPETQSFALAHPDPAWVPPDDRSLRVNTNYGRPRIWVSLGQIKGTDAAPMTASSPKGNRPETPDQRPVELSQENEELSPEVVAEFIRSLNMPDAGRFGGGSASSTGQDDQDGDCLLSEEEFLAEIRDM